MEEGWRWTGNPYDLLTPSFSDADYKEDFIHGRLKKLQKPDGGGVPRIRF